MSDEPLPKSEIILYQVEDCGTRLQVRLQGETVWLMQKLMADLFLTFYLPRPRAELGRSAPKVRNVKAQGQRGTSASLGMRPPQDHEPCKGGMFRVMHVFVAPLQGSSRFSDVTQGCAPSSLPLGYYIAGPSALRTSCATGCILKLLAPIVANR